MLLQLDFLQKSTQSWTCCSPVVCLSLIDAWRHLTPNIQQFSGKSCGQAFNHSSQLSLILQNAFENTQILTCSYEQFENLPGYGTCGSNDYNVILIVTVGMCPTRWLLLPSNPVISVSKISSFKNASELKAVDTIGNYSN